MTDITREHLKKYLPKIREEEEIKHFSVARRLSYLKLYTTLIEYVWWENIPDGTISLKMLDKIVDTFLEEEEKMYVREKFGLDDGICKGYKLLAEMYGVNLSKASSTIFLGLKKITNLIEEGRIAKDLSKIYNESKW